MACILRSFFSSSSSPIKWSTISLWKTYPKLLSVSACRFEFPNDLSLTDVYAERDEDELIKLRRAAFQPITGGRCALVIHPYIKWGPMKKKDTTPAIQLAESVALIKSLQEWEVSGQEIVPLTSFCKNKFFGTGKLLELKRKLDEIPYCTAIFVNVNQLSASQHSFLENFFGKPVYDRYLIVMQIFREHAFTKEAKLQIALAEVPYLASRSAFEHSESLSRIGGSATLISGTTIHTPKDSRRMILHRYEAKIKDQLEKLKTSRGTDRAKRRRDERPIVAVVGYTNAGKTSLVKALSGNEKLCPKSHLFATLDVTFHMGMLPCNMKVYYVDTIGFISDIPTHLIEPFLVTLEDAMLADVIIHVQDVSRPDWIFQRDQVTKTLEKINIEKKMLKHVIMVANKMDLLDASDSKIIPADMVRTSCANSQGIDNLKLQIEEEVISATGRLHLVVRAKTASDEYNFLRKEAAVADVQADCKNPNYSLLSVIITQATLDKFKRNFISS